MEFIFFVFMLRWNISTKTECNHLFLDRKCCLSICCLSSWTNIILAQFIEMFVTISNNRKFNGLMLLFQNNFTWGRKGDLPPISFHSCHLIIFAFTLWLCCLMRCAFYFLFEKLYNFIIMNLPQMHLSSPNSTLFIIAITSGKNVIHPSFACEHIFKCE